MKKFKDLVQSLDEVKKFKLPRGEQEVDSYMEKGTKGKKVQVVIAKKSSKFKVYIDGQELATYKNEKEARKNAKELIKLLGEDLSDFIEEVLEEPKIEDTFGFSNGLKGNQTYNDVAEKIATIKQDKDMSLEKTIRELEEKVLYKSPTGWQFELFGGKVRMTGKNVDTAMNIEKADFKNLQKIIGQVKV